MKAEFQNLKPAFYDFEIKRGEVLKGKEVITNEDAGRMLLAFDREEPWSCHQIYKVFDDLYSEIFGRKDVTATRIVMLHEAMKVIADKISAIQNKPFGHYTLTKYFLLTLLSMIMRSDPVGRKIFDDPQIAFMDEKSFAAFRHSVSTVISAAIVDLNYEVAEMSKSAPFDYKENLKSPQKVRELIATLMRSFEKDVARKKAGTFGDLFVSTKG